MKNNKKKAFTLVELLVVIAILAVLASVSIVGYLGFTEKAKQSNDLSLVSTMNTVLKADEPLNGKPDDAKEVVNVLKDHGLDVSKLSAEVEDNFFVWEKTTNQMFYLDNNYNFLSKEKVDNSNTEYWAFAGSQNTADKLIENTIDESWGLYLSTSLIAPESGYDLSKIRGIISGEEYSILGNCFYTNSNLDPKSTLYIDANISGNLSIDDADATVTHKGNVSNVNIINVDSTNCYKEFGKVDGKISIENGLLHLNKTSEVSEIVVEKNNSSKILLEDVQKPILISGKTPETNVEIETKGEKVKIIIDENLKTNNENTEQKAQPVNNETELNEQINKNSFIEIGSDFEISNPIYVTKTTIIDGSSHKITAKSNSNVTRMFMIRENLSDIKLTMKNLELDNNNMSQRGVQINSPSLNCGISLYNTRIVNATHYAINLALGSANTSLYISNSYIEGWSAINNYSTISDMRIDNSELVGVGKYENEAFATICYEGDTTGVTQEHSSSIYSKFFNCKIYAKATIENCAQEFIAFNDNSMDNLAVFEKCEFIKVPFGAAELGGVYDQGKNNRIIVDGKLITDYNSL